MTGADRSFELAALGGFRSRACRSAHGHARCAGSYHASDDTWTCWCACHPHTAETWGDGVVHLCPPGDEARMPCCGGWPLERLGERMTADPALVTCPGKGGDS